jgi:DNA adenine methylase
VNDKFTPLYSFETGENGQGGSATNCERPFLSRRSGSRNTEGLYGFRRRRATGYDIILNRCSFSGSTLSGGFSQEASNGRFTPSSIDRIAALDFADIEIHNADFLEFVESALVAEPDSPVLDPPYFLEKSKLYGNNGDMRIV